MDPDTGGRFTEKLYESEKTQSQDGTWKQQEVRLLPDSTDPTFKLIILRDDGASHEIAILAEFLQVIG